MINVVIRWISHHMNTHNEHRTSVFMHKEATHHTLDFYFKAVEMLQHEPQKTKCELLEMPHISNNNKIENSEKKIDEFL
jgi:hypothetical protein